MGLSILIMFRAITLPHIKILGGDISMPPKEIKLDKLKEMTVESDKNYIKLREQYNFKNLQEVIQVMIGKSL
jgi:hypothetical protein